MFSIARGLWQARHLSGDPRVIALGQYQEKKEVQLELALMLSYEPASWYYAVPYLSRKHVKSLASLKLHSAG